MERMALLMISAAEVSSKREGSDPVVWLMVERSNGVTFKVLQVTINTQI